MRERKLKKNYVKHKWAFVICALAMIVGVFEVYAISHYLYIKQQEEALQRVYHIEENDAKRYNKGTQAQNRSFGDTEVTIYYSLDEQGNVIPTIQNKLDELVSKQYTAQQLTTTPLNFFKAIRKPSDFSGLDEVTLYQSSYTIDGSKVEQTIFTKHEHLYLTQANELITNTELFQQADAAKQVLLEQIDLVLESSGATEQQRTGLRAEMEQLPFDQWEFAYRFGHLVVALPDNPLHLADVSILMSHLYTSIKSEYLSQMDLETYAQYVEQQNVVASNNSNGATQNHEDKHSEGKKLVALTFDDGPDATLTPRVLDVLSQYQAKATFFMLGSQIEGQEALVQRMVAEGHELGNHTWGHPELTKISSDNVVKEYTSTQEAIAKASNGVVPQLLRPPYGAFNDLVNEKIDIPLVMWSVDTLDWKHRDTASILNEVRQQTFDGSVILMHDIHPTSVEALPSVLQYLREEGYHVVTVSELQAQYGLSPEIYIQ